MIFLVKKKKKDIRKSINLILASIFTILAGISAWKNRLEFAIPLQAIGIMSYNAWLFIIRDEKWGKKK